MNEFLNKNKLAASVAVIGLGATAASFAAGSDKEVLPSHETDNISVTVSATEVVGGSDSDWEHGAAERAIKEALEKAAEQLGITKSNYLEQLEDLEFYNNAEKAVEMAHESNSNPKKGALTEVTIEATKDSENDLSYKLTGAATIDSHSN